MAKLDVQVLDSRDFILRRGFLVTEASDCGYTGPQRLYDDACDVGIAVRSHRTGRVVRFYLHNDVREDGEVVAWTFEPAPEERDVPCGLLIYND